MEILMAKLVVASLGTVLAGNPPYMPIVTSETEDIMAKRQHHIVQDERGQDQPTSKKAAHRTEPTMPKDASS
jgi:hypothetical protein